MKELWMRISVFIRADRRLLKLGIYTMDHDVIVNRLYIGPNVTLNLNGYRLLVNKTVYLRGSIISSLELRDFVNGHSPKN